jgi:hypothetical protein
VARRHPLLLHQRSHLRRPLYGRTALYVKPTGI